MSAVIPCYNDWDTLPLAIESLLNQTHNLKEILIIDDGSTEKCSTNKIPDNHKIKFIRNETNKGRGYSRNIALHETSTEFLVTVDATNILENHFIEKALVHFAKRNIAAVSGTLTTRIFNGVKDRWRSRHLFKERNPNASPRECDMLITYGTLLRRSLFLEVGGFDESLYFKEDHAMGQKLANNGYSVIGDPKIKIYPSKSNSFIELMERYSRWYMDIDDKPSLKGYLHNIRASIRPMMQKDLDEKDYLSVLISFMVPHFQFFYSLREQFKTY